MNETNEYRKSEKNALVSIQKELGSLHSDFRNLNEKHKETGSNSDLNDDWMAQTQADSERRRAAEKVEKKRREESRVREAAILAQKRRLREEEKARRREKERLEREQEAARREKERLEREREAARREKERLEREREEAEARRVREEIRRKKEKEQRAKTRAIMGSLFDEETTDKSETDLFGRSGLISRGQALFEEEEEEEEDDENDAVVREKNERECRKMMSKRPENTKASNPKNKEIEIKSDEEEVSDVEKLQRANDDLFGRLDAPEPTSIFGD